MPFDVGEFLGVVGKVNGLTSPAHFEVMFGSSNMRYLCTAATLPGRSIETDTIHRAPEIPRVRPVLTSYPPVSLTFMLDGNGEVLSTLQSKLDAVIPSSSFEVNFPSSYQEQIDITQYNYDGSEVLKMTLYDAYVASLSDVALDWSGGNQIQTVTATVSYFKWVST